MPIDGKVAAAIARRKGLNLSDAAALAAMADSEEEADALASSFAVEESVADIVQRIER